MSSYDERAARLVEYLNGVPDTEQGRSAAQIQEDLGWDHYEFRTGIAHARWLWGKEIIVCEGAYVGGYYTYVYATANTPQRADRYIRQYEAPIRTMLQHEMVMIDRRIAAFGSTVGTTRRKVVIEMTLATLP